MLSEGNDSEGEDMYGFLPKKTAAPTAVRRENIYEKNPRRPARRVTFKDEPPRVRLIQRRHSCADNFRTFAARKYEYQPLIPIEQLPSYPNPARRSGVAAAAAASFRDREGRRGAFPDMPAGAAVPRASPPCYQVAVRRAASFSAARGVNREYMVRRPPPYPKFAPQIPPPMPLLSRQFSSSTSDLYVDSLALKNLQSRDVVAADGSTSTLMSEATVYRKVGPRDYVSVGDQPRHKTFRTSMESSSDEGVDMNSCTVRVFVDMYTLYIYSVGTA